MIFFKAEANSKIGGGHLHRCLNLAKELKLLGQNACFLFAQSSENAVEKVSRAGFDFRLISAEHEFDITAYLEVVKSNDLILFDTDNPAFYEGELLNQLKENNVSTACFTISDAYNYLNDIIINPNIIALKHQYKIRKEASTFLGPRFMVYSEQMRKNYSFGDESQGNELLVFFGNADPNGVTLSVINYLPNISNKFDKVNLLIGALNPKKDEILSCAGQIQLDQLKILTEIKDMAGLYKKSALAITAAGMTMWELALFKVPQLVVASSQREVEYARYLDELGYVKSLGKYNDLRFEQLNEQNLDSLTRDLKLQEFKNAVDINGAENIASALVKYVSQQ